MNLARLPLSRPPLGRLPRRALAVAALPLLLAVGLVGCARSVDGVASATPPSSRSPSADLPQSADELEPLVVPSVPSGLPRLPDQELSPPAGAKSLDDVASYAPDPGRESGVLEGYGYRFGWERFWGHSRGPTTSVFVDQFESSEGAAAYAVDLAANEAERYNGMLRQHPAQLPDGCRELTVAEPDYGDELTGPSVFAWCGRGVFSVGVTSVAASVEAAKREVRAVLADQLDRLPPS